MAILNVKSNFTLSQCPNHFKNIFNKTMVDSIQLCMNILKKSQNSNLRQKKK